jgi:hypothetical protein
MPSFVFFRDLLAVAVVVGWLALPVAAALDARRRCRGRAVAWAALAAGIALPYVGVLLYAAGRPRETIGERRHRRAAARYLTALTGGAADATEPPEPAATTPASALIDQPALLEQAAV